MNSVLKLYEDLAGVKIQTKKMEVENIKYLVNRSGFLKNMYHILHKKNLILGAKWKPDDVNNTNFKTNTNEIFYSEVTSGLRYKINYEK